MDSIRTVACVARSPVAAVSRSMKPASSGVRMRYRSIRLSDVHADEAADEVRHARSADTPQNLPPCTEDDSAPGLVAHEAADHDQTDEGENDGQNERRHAGEQGIRNNHDGCSDREGKETRDRGFHAEPNSSGSRPSSSRANVSNAISGSFMI